jgi:hypothetical protein
MSTSCLPDAELIVDQFQEYRSALAGKRVIVRHRTECHRIGVLKPADDSRYFKEGRIRLMARLRRRLAGWFESKGLLLTLTFDPKKIDLDEAWHQVGELRRAFMNRVNLWRHRHGMPRCLSYLSVLEEQPGTGYPHIHMVFPGLAWLAPGRYLWDTWGIGSVDVQARYRGCNPIGYVCKYILKMSGWKDLSMALCRMYRTRLYSVSHDYLPESRHEPEWVFLTTTTVERLEWLTSGLIDHGGLTICLS